MSSANRKQATTKKHSHAAKAERTHASHASGGAPRAKALRDAEAKRVDDPNDENAEGTLETDDASATEAAGGEAAPRAELTPEEQVTATQALARIKPRAMALKADQIGPYRIVPAVAIVNVRTARAALARFRGDMARALPQIDLTHYDAIEDTALALVAAANDADKVSSDGEVLKNIDKAREIRGRLLPVLHGLALNGHVPMKVYNDIASGSGIRDVAKDCVDLPAAFRKYGSALEGKHPISDADLAAADAVGTWLLRNMGTKGARVQKGVPSEVIDLRNRVATLLGQDYEDVGVIAHYFLRDGHLDAVPPLRSRFVSRRAASPTPEPGASPTPPPIPSSPASPAAPAPGAPTTGAAAPPSPTPALPTPVTPPAGAAPSPGTPSPLA